jgi:hypothetical protein
MSRMDFGIDDDLFVHENGRKVYHASWYHNADYSGCDISYSKSCSQNSDEGALDTMF